ncbi:hypothetical protein [Williamsia sterculiae]|uniref:Uncharacterized protein n=1 Tax=Williamsia sterculiae TaxID=1344003 RepID=A0A1N7FXC3_9NOCA|nr:hypothetical protein [Williamsia sterculiae]SIS04982.1 hypothetical protein SAMN05445060_2374 [Williamsia sterculiae]
MRLPVHMEPVAKAMATVAVRFPNRSRLEFDEDGVLVDWQEMTSSGWVRNCPPDYRVYVVAGGAALPLIRSYLLHHAFGGDVPAVVSGLTS